MSVFELGGSRIIIVTDSVLETILPGEKPPALPAFVAYTIKVQNIDETHKLLLNNGFTPRISSLSGIFVPSAEALGATIIFRQVSK